MGLCLRIWESRSLGERDHSGPQRGSCKGPGGESRGREEGRSGEVARSRPAGCTGMQVPIRKVSCQGQPSARFEAQGADPGSAPGGGEIT